MEIIEKLNEILAPRPTLDNRHLNPEPVLNIWQCRHCDCDCAGDSTYMLCNSCLIRNNEADARNEAARERFYERDRELRELREISREYSHYQN